MAVLTGLCLQACAGEKCGLIVCVDVLPVSGAVAVNIFDSMFSSS
jgi:hypothetical protein